MLLFKVYNAKKHQKKLGGTKSLGDTAPYYLLVGKGLAVTGQIFKGLEPKSS